MYNEDLPADLGPVKLTAFSKDELQFNSQMSEDVDRMGRLKEKLKANKTQRAATRAGRGSEYYGYLAKTVDDDDKKKSVPAQKPKGVQKNPFFTEKSTADVYSDAWGMFPAGQTASAHQGLSVPGGSISGSSVVPFVPNKEGLRTYFPEQGEASESDEDTRKLIERIKDQHKRRQGTPPRYDENRYNRRIPEKFEELVNEHATNTAINTKPRLMENGDWAIPFSARFIMRSIKNFSPFECTIDVRMTMNIRIKFTGLPNQQEVMKWAYEGNLRCNVNNDNGPLF